MAYVADLHIHSRFSRACSSQLTIANLSKWAKIKGIDLIGTGDFLHPLWQAELKRDLYDKGNGIFEHDGVKFLLTSEISCIYLDKGKTRRIHLLICLPSFEVLGKLTSEFLKRRINISSDGRPITGLSAKELSEIVWSIVPTGIIIPCHVWTPWFSLFGSESGYDFLTECFEDLSDKIYAIETGLSSEPAMNWRIAELDDKAIVSFSDAHSLSNLGRESTIFSGNLSFDELLSDLVNQNIKGTIEFFPEEGKYHYTGHRNCGVVYSIKDLAEKGVICPKCGKKLTVGVMQRVEDLASRETDDLELITDNGVVKSKKFPKRPGFRMLVQLSAVIAEAYDLGSSSQKVQNMLDLMIAQLGPELKILTKLSLDQIKAVAGSKITEGIDRVRQGQLHIEPGYDGTYGVVKIWGEDNNDNNAAVQIGLF